MGEGAGPVSANRNYLLVVLLLVLAFNQVDRMAVGLLLQDIKRELLLTDTQLGFLTGLAFALFYAVMGIPIARWADRGNRVTIIALTTALWSAAVALCGAAASFVQLLLIRVAVAVGEAGCYPPALSLISDHFPRGERPRAVSRYMLGVPLALVIGYFAAGWVNQFYGWRVTFVIIGLPGLFLALLARATLQEPRRGRATSDLAQPPAPPAPALGLGEVLFTLWSNRAFRHLLFCFSLTAFFAYGILQWQPAFFMRSHGFKSGELGTWFAVVHGIGGLLGTYLGGELASRYAANNERLQLAGTALLYVLLAFLKAGVYLAPDRELAFAVLMLSALGGAAGNAPIYAATQTLVPQHMRAMSVALLLFFSNLIGMGLGPLAAGMLSDALRPTLGDESLRYALLILCPGYFWAAWHLWRASRATGDANAAIRAAPGGQAAEIVVAE